MRSTTRPLRTVKCLSDSAGESGGVEAILAFRLRRASSRPSAPLTKSGISSRFVGGPAAGSRAAMPATIHGRIHGNERLIFSLRVGNDSEACIWEQPRWRADENKPPLFIDRIADHKWRHGPVVNPPGFLCQVEQ